MTKWGLRFVLRLVLRIIKAEAKTADDAVAILSDIISDI